MALRAGGRKGRLDDHPRECVIDVANLAFEEAWRVGFERAGLKPEDGDLRSTGQGNATPRGG